MMLLVYLWGIETMKQLLALAGCVELLVYLWGIETKKKLDISSVQW